MIAAKLRPSRAKSAGQLPGRGRSGGVRKMSSPLPAVLLGALLFVTGCAAGDDPRQAAAPADPAEAAQLEDFRQLTFGQPGGQLAKWQQPLRIALVEPPGARSEEHTSELQSLMRISYAVFCLKK